MATLPPSTDFTGSGVTQGNFKTAISTLRTFIADLLGTDSANKSAARTALGLAIGTDVQAYDAATAKTNTAQNWTASQRSAPITDNDGSFDLSGAGNNYTSTPTSAVAITFTNIASNAGKSGYLTLVNSTNYAFTAHTNTKITAADLAKIVVTGTHVLPYLCDGTDVFILGVWTRP